MKLTIKKTDVKLIVEHARNGLPNEVCGLIAGTVEGGSKTVEKVYLLSNPDQSPEHFSIDPKEHLSAIKDMRRNGWLPLGNFHSHPSTPAWPSMEDIRLAYDPSASYLILSLAEEVPVLKAFGITGDTVKQEEIVAIP
ncbi:M67 family metallopeptidase [Lacrimispora sphenoides]|uniref:Proteasome lid subunit RPN8/RPN11, contains Jab1/MPN metalloenzyme (JAMM) motif n=1 Tax=Lacrimispora sphenoides JCM 1415 TaxID=1297793 RepID=A0ABY1CGE8_9FIRM|nr:M67 family metallopeptidase [Lacrimispora sphenoides]SEU02280.1 Proteasome lid subunit RPN8/RPN11, contains Jab1/MPN metalloenzyme (JAMM) motif [[Clostridium] sphenoides JCM 1415]SUY48651.1 Mov34/MPN/PAD-1 [Lacrimispora sphenoides]